MKGVHFRANELVFCPIAYIEVALDRTMVQSSNLICLESDVRAIKRVWFCICMSVCLSVRAWEESCTFMKL